MFITRACAGVFLVVIYIDTCMSVLLYCYLHQYVNVWSSILLSISICECLFFYIVIYINMWMSVLLYCYLYQYVNVWSSVLLYTSLYAYVWSSVLLYFVVLCLAFQTSRVMQICFDNHFVVNFRPIWFVTCTSLVLSYMRTYSKLYINLWILHMNQCIYQNKKCSSIPATIIEPLAWSCTETVQGTQLCQDYCYVASTSRSLLPRRLRIDQQSIQVSPNLWVCNI